MMAANERKTIGIKKHTLHQEMWMHKELYAMLLLAVIVIIVFHYIPMYGLQLAFKDIKIGQTFSQGEWVGLKHFKRFFSTRYFGITVRNTLLISLSTFIVFPIPILFALLLHNSISSKIKKIAQTTTFLPHLLSIVIVMSIVKVFCAGDVGLINILLNRLGFSSIPFFSSDEWVIPLYVISGLWQTMGYAAVVYIAALSSVSYEMTEAAMIDGASKRQRMFMIDLPAIKSTIITMLILRVGTFVSVGAEKMLLVQTDLNLNASEIIATYVYKAGILQAQYGFSTAVGLLNNVVNLLLVLIVNAIAKKFTETSLF